MEGVSSGWSNDIQPSSQPNTSESSQEIFGHTDVATDSSVIKGTVLSRYEDTIRDPHKDRSSSKSKLGKPAIEVQAPNMQAFLGTQLEVIDRLKKEEEEAAMSAQEKEKASKAISASDGGHAQSSRYFSSSADSGAISDQIGPVQFNMGGIQVDADDMLQRLKNREDRSGANNVRLEIQTPNTETATKDGGDQKAQNEQLANFFSSLMRKDRSGSPYSRKTDEDR